MAATIARFGPLRRPAAATATRTLSAMPYGVDRPRGTAANPAWRTLRMPSADAAISSGSRALSQISRSSVANTTIVAGAYDVFNFKPEMDRLLEQATHSHGIDPVQMGEYVQMMIREIEVGSVTAPFALAKIFGGWGQFQASGQRPPSNLLGGILKAYLLAEAPETAMQVYAVYKQCGPLSAAGYKTLLDCASATGRVAGYLEIMDEMENYGIPITAAHWQGLLVACLRGRDTHQAEIVLEKLEDMGEALAAPVYVQLAKNAVFDRVAGKAADWLSELQKTSNWTPTMQHCALAISVFRLAVRCFDADAAERVLALVKSWGPMAAMEQGILHTAMVLAANRGAPSFAKEVMAHAALHGIEVDESYKESLVMAYIVRRDMLGAVHEIIKLLKEGWEMPESMCQAFFRSCTPENAHDLVDILRTMQVQGAPPPRFMYHLVMRVLAKKGYTLEARDLMAEMESEWGVKPDATCYAYAIESCAHTVRFKYNLAISIVHMMKERGVELNGAVYSSLMLLFLRNGEIDKSLDVAFTCLNSGMKLYPPFLAMAIRSAARAGMATQAADLAALAEERGCRLDFKEVRAHIRWLQMGLPANFVVTNPPPGVMEDGDLAKVEIPEPAAGPLVEAVGMEDKPDAQDQLSDGERALHDNVDTILLGNKKTTKQ